MLKLIRREDFPLSYNFYLKGVVPMSEKKEKYYQYIAEYINGEWKITEGWVPYDKNIPYLLDELKADATDYGKAVVAKDFEPSKAYRKMLDLFYEKVAKYNRGRVALEDTLTKKE